MVYGKRVSADALLCTVRKLCVYAKCVHVMTCAEISLYEL